MADTSMPEPADSSAPVNQPAEAPTPLDADPKIDALVDDIQHQNSDAELSAAFTPSTAVDKPNLWQRYLNHKKWAIPLTVLVVILAVIFGIPASRYKVLGLVIKKTYTITVNDATTGTPVSKAQVKLGTTTGMTDAEGKLHLKRLPVGQKQATISKQYYRTTSSKAFVGLRSGKNSQTIRLQATGRQVYVTVINKITQAAVANAEITALGTSARTNTSGQATLVLPAQHSTAAATIKSDGYNDATSTIQITTNVVPANTFSLVPSGRAYFLSNASGKVDVVSANYDGSDRQTLLPGTGYEDMSGIQLIPAPDQKNLALITRRTDTSNAVGLYNVATGTGKVTTIEADAIQSVSVVGWSNGQFVYLRDLSNANAWTPGRQALKSYNASSGAITVLDQSQATGTSYSDYTGQSFSVPSIVDGAVVYTKSWSGGYGVDLSSKSNGIYSVQPGSTTSKSLHDLAIPAGATYSVVSQETDGPSTVYFASPTTSSADYNAGALYFKYSKGVLTQPNNFTASDFQNPDVRDFVALSPNGSKLLYTDDVDGATVASESDSSGTKIKLASLHAPASVIGWLSNDYVLVSQDSSQLYVISADPSNTNAKPLALASFYSNPPTQY